MTNGKDLIELGYKPGPWFAEALNHINTAGLFGDDLISYLEANKPKEIKALPLHDTSEFDFYLHADTIEEENNVAAVMETMRAVTRTPTVIHAAIMPDACPAGPLGTIPVGGVVVAKNAIHPGMHSADICCSVMMTEFKGVSPKALLDAISSVTHFGPGGRTDMQPPEVLMVMACSNKLIRGSMVTRAISDFGTQGDGNHFAYVGISQATGNPCLVTHHGSRGLGALLYKAGMKIAEGYRQKLSPETLKQNAWIPYDTSDGEDYWDALQIIREWTFQSHLALHRAAGDQISAKVVNNFWNEHNFVFKDGDNFIHAKGATPLLSKYMSDYSGRSIIPLNMSEPILIVEKPETGNELGFAPHGAGRNISRTAHKRKLEGKTDEEIFAEETANIDARFFFGRIDISELPSAYKNANDVREQIQHYGLARVVDEIIPYGSIMAGEIDALWKRKSK